MVVYHVINSLRIGGAENLVTDLLTEFDNSSEFQHVLILLDGYLTPLKDKLHGRKNITIHTIGSSLYSPMILPRLFKLLKGAKTIHLHLFPTIYWVVISQFLFNGKSKLIYTEHSTENNRRGKWIFKIIDRIIYKRISTIVCISSSTKSNLLKHIGEDFADRCIVINNGVNVVEFKSVEPIDKLKLGFNNSDIILLQVASFRPAKDQPTVIKALKLMPSNVKLVLIGDGPLISTCVNLVNDLCLSDRVKFLGVKNDVGAYMKMCDFIVVSSNYEGFGIVAVEGMACGKPVIASNVVGLSEVVSNFGLLFERNNSNKLSEILLSLINDDIQYREISRRCLLRSHDFNIESVAQSYLNLY